MHQTPPTFRSKAARQPLRVQLAERLGGVPVTLGRDDRTGGLAEGRIGAGEGADRFLFVPLGTGIAKVGETLFTPLRAAVEERVTFRKLPAIVPAALGDTASCLGAGLLAWDLLDMEAAA
jgi:glucokinase